MRSAMMTVLSLVLLFGIVAVAPVTAAPIGDPAFQRTWERTDKPVADGLVSRTWMWGAPALSGQGFIGIHSEDYADSPGGFRVVQYFDKSRMEITNSSAVDDGLWYVTNGLLVVEMMTGRIQTGDAQFIDRSPAQVNVAGDPDDPLTYAVLAQRRGDAPLSVGASVMQRIGTSGQVAIDPGLAGRGVTAAMHVAETNHTVASVFWSFMNSEGLVFQNGQLIHDRIFVNPYYATGFPITEAYWANVKVGGTPRDVLIQCFERRCLTYTPENPSGWQVEAGNVGQHYFRWRYGDIPPVDECVNINTASFEQLQDIIHIGPDRAQQIINMRPFSSVDELINVSGIGPTLLAQIKEQGLACV